MANKPIKVCFILLVIREIRYHFRPTRMAIRKKTDNNTFGKDVEKMDSKL